MKYVLKSEWQVVQRSVCQRDGRWFLKLLQAETDRMEGWCRQMELDQRENALPEESMSLCDNAVASILHCRKGIIYLTSNFAIYILLSTIAS